MWLALLPWGLFAAGVAVLLAVPVFSHLRHDRHTGSDRAVTAAEPTSAEERSTR
jgi:hypothetical protein